MCSRHIVCGHGSIKLARSVFWLGTLASNHCEPTCCRSKAQEWQHMAKEISRASQILRRLARDTFVLLVTALPASMRRVA